MATDSPALTKPGLWPGEFLRHTESEAEEKVYTALKTSLPRGWYAWHSLRLRTRNRGEFSEADFIIADPGRPSVLILEVKGGQIEQRNGRWYQYKRCQALTFSTLLLIIKRIVASFWRYDFSLFF